jgi:hypothetical protein
MGSGVLSQNGPTDPTSIVNRLQQSLGRTDTTYVAIGMFATSKVGVGITSPALSHRLAQRPHVRSPGGRAEHDRRPVQSEGSAAEERGCRSTDGPIASRRFCSDRYKHGLVAETDSPVRPVSRRASGRRVPTSPPTRGTQQSPRVRRHRTRRRPDSIAASLVRHRSVAETARQSNIRFIPRLGLIHR